MNKKFTLSLIAGLVSSGLVAQNALAEVYVGGQAGYTNLDNACYVSDGCDDEGGAAGLYLGYQASEHVGIELGADWLGKYDVNYLDNGALATSEHNLSAISLMPKFNFPIADNYDVFFKLGAAYMQFGDANDVVPTAAVGAEYHISKDWGARLAYQRYQGFDDSVFDDMDTNVFTVGLTYKFGQAEAAPAPVAVEPKPEPKPIVEPKPEPKPEPIPEWITKQHAKQYDESTFEVGSAVLSDAGKQALTPLMHTLVRFPDAEAVITGHTDSTGAASFNQRLSEQRAQAVADFLTAGGVNPDKLTVQGKGESSPIASNNTSEGRKQNRRVEVEIPKFEYKTQQ
ncbi:MULTISPECIES: OmpA family protein [unclassified Vibrio]|uniref:OmpA family protein n=1 Tax=Vibrio sp. HB236076 TaxID=3232307 RepID=A0AB39HM29_9VIBR|nr:OmpA family protein [Vibrio sp. HB161653]MDP5252670.1 OmpA family protein [Vibrio sp. HB161653]